MISANRLRWRPDRREPSFIRCNGQDGRGYFLLYSHHVQVFTYDVKYTQFTPSAHRRGNKPPDKIPSRQQESPFISSPLMEQPCWQRGSLPSGLIPALPGLPDSPEPFSGIYTDSSSRQMAAQLFSSLRLYSLEVFSSHFSPCSSISDNKSDKNNKNIAF